MCLWSAVFTWRWSVSFKNLSLKVIEKFGSFDGLPVLLACHPAIMLYLPAPQPGVSRLAWLHGTVDASPGSIIGLPSSPDLITWDQLRAFSGSLHKRKSERFDARKWFSTCTFTVLKMEGAMWQGTQAASRNWELTANKEAGSSVLEPQGIEFSQEFIFSKNELGNRYLPRASKWELSPANILISAFQYPEQRTQLSPPGLLTYNTVNKYGYCVKLLNLWLFVTQQ